MSGRTRDPNLAACAWQLWLYATVNSHDIQIKHKRGEDLPLADALSCMAQDQDKASYVAAAVQNLGLQFVDPVLNNYVFFDSDW